MAARARYEQAAERAVEWLATPLRDDGSYGPDADDLACYYKSPYLFQLSGRTREAARLLAFIQDRFMRPDHDFTTSAGHKSDNAAVTWSERKTQAVGWRGCSRSSRTCEQACSCALTAPDTLFATYPRTRPCSIS